MALILFSTFVLLKALTKSNSDAVASYNKFKNKRNEKLVISNEIIDTYIHGFNKHGQSSLYIQNIIQDLEDKKKIKKVSKGQIISKTEDFVKKCNVKGKYFKFFTTALSINANYLITTIQNHLNKFNQFNKKGLKIITPLQYVED